VSLIRSRRADTEVDGDVDDAENVDEERACPSTRERVATGGLLVVGKRAVVHLPGARAGTDGGVFGRTLRATMAMAFRGSSYVQPRLRCS